MKKLNIFLATIATSFVLVKTYELVEMVKADKEYQKDFNSNKEETYKRQYIKLPFNK